MTDSEQPELDRELCRRWPKKFSREDLDCFWAELEPWGLDQVTDALRRFKSSSRFIPKPKEIIALLPRRMDREQKTLAQLEGSFADVLRRQNQHYTGRGDAEVLLRHYRGLYWREFPQLQTALVDTDNSSPVHAQLEHRISSLRRQIESECLNAICASGAMTEREARRAVAFIFDTPEMFRMLLDELRQIGSADDARKAEAVFA